MMGIFIWQIRVKFMIFFYDLLDKWVRVHPKKIEKHVYFLITFIR